MKKKILDEKDMTSGIMVVPTDTNSPEYKEALVILAKNAEAFKKINMAEELKQEHIIPYLPYELMAVIDGLSYKIKGVIKDLACDIEGVDLHFPNTVIIERRNENLKNVKPILKPLSDLLDLEDFKSIGIFGRNEWKIKQAVRDERVGLINHHLFHILVKHHYDVYRLIDKGLAIDVKTLKK